MGENINELILRRVIKLAFEVRGEKAFKVCGSNGGDAVHYYYPLNEGHGITFSNHGYLDIHGFNPYTKEEYNSYAPKIVEW